MFFLQFQIRIDDGLPKKICEDCAAKTKAFFEFKKIVCHSDQKLRETIEQASSSLNVLN